MNKAVTLRELLAIIVRRGRLILCAAVVISILAGGLQLILQLREAGKEYYTPEKIEERYQTALETYEQQYADMNDRIKTIEEKLSRQQEYNENSLLMQIDPYNKFSSSIVIAIADIDNAAFQQVFLLEGTPVDFIISKIQAQYVAWYNNLDLETASPTFSGIPEKYFREIISFSQTGGGTISLTVYGRTDAEAQSICNAVYTCMQKVLPTIETATYPHQLSVISSSKKTLVDQGLETLQQTNLNTAISYQTELETVKQQLEDLAEPVREEGYSSATIVKSVLKWCAIGLVGGVFLACVWILAAYILQDRFETSRQIEHLLSASFLGSVAEISGIWNRMEIRLLEEPTWSNQDQATAFITENVKLRAEAGQPIALLSTLPLTQEHTEIDLVLQTVRAQGYPVCFVGAAEVNPDTMKTVCECSAVILAERLHASGPKSMAAVAKLAKSLDRPVLGFVLV